METESNIEKKLYDRISELQQELDKYKAKEKELRDLIDTYIHDDYGELTLDDILEIFDEEEQNMKGNKVIKKNIIFRIFCKHEWWIAHKKTEIFIASGDWKFEVCCKCGKVRRKYFVPNIDGS